MEEKHLLYRVEDRIGYITINLEPQGNAITAEAVQLFHEYLDQAEKDENVRGIQLTGSGEKSFCTGAQLGGVMKGGGTEGSTNRPSGYANLLDKLVRFPKPTVARVNGFCLAGGLGFMMACDIAIAKEEAKFGAPEVNVGLWPLMIGALIFRNVLQKKAMEMILLGERMTAQEALKMGLISRVTTAKNLDEETGKILKKLASLSPIGVRIGKQAYYDMVNMPLKEALLFLSGKLEEMALTEDAREGITAFMQKREPVFTGR
jgi:enoyl-CoA hydratase/carnithine racemase